MSERYGIVTCPACCGTSIETELRGRIGPGPDPNKKTCGDCGYAWRQDLGPVTVTEAVMGMRSVGDQIAKARRDERLDVAKHVLSGLYAGGPTEASEGYMVRTSFLLADALIAEADK